jgi:hypothetical protein
MGSEAIWVPLVIGAISAGAQYYNTQQTAKRQDNALAAQLRADASKQRQADQQTAQLINKTRASTDADEKAGALAKFTQAVAANRANAERPMLTQGAVSDAYKAAGSNAALGMAAKAGGLADLVSSIDAPRQQRQNDVRDFDDYRNAIGMIRRDSAGDDFLAQMRLRGIKRNPWIDAAAQVGQGYANNYGGGGFSTADSSENVAPSMGNYGSSMGSSAGLDAYNLYGLMPGYKYSGY